MTTLFAALPQLVVNMLVVFFLFLSIIMVLVVLIQRPTGGGLSGAFGGAAAGSSQTAFGARTGDVLTMVTIGIFVAFLLTAVLLNFQMDPTGAPPATTIGNPDAPVSTDVIPIDPNDADAPTSQEIIDAATETPTDAGPPVPVDGDPSPAEEDTTGDPPTTPVDDGGSTEPPADEPPAGRSQGA